MDRMVLVAPRDGQTKVFIWLWLLISQVASFYHEITFEVLAPRPSSSLTFLPFRSFFFLLRIFNNTIFRLLIAARVFKSTPLSEAHLSISLWESRYKFLFSNVHTFVFRFTSFLFDRQVFLKYHVKSTYIHK